MAGTAAGIALLLGAGGLAWAMAGSDGDEDPVVKVTAVDPATTRGAVNGSRDHARRDDGAAHHAGPDDAAPHHRATHHRAAGAGAGRAAGRDTGGPAARGRRGAKRKQPSQQAPATTAAPHVDPPTHPPAPPADVVGFSAGAAYGSCSEDPPYDVYSGTASPGTTVTISSRLRWRLRPGRRARPLGAEGRVQRCPPRTRRSR